MDTDILNDLFLFEGLNSAQRALLEPLFVQCDFEAGTTIFNQGDLAEYIYAVVEGEIMVNYKPDDGPVIVVAHVCPGSVVGWSAAVGSRFYTSAAVCKTYTQLMRVCGDDLRKLYNTHPETGGVILDRLATVIAERLHSTHDLVMSLLRLGMHSPVDQPGG